jgi:hypothetical protein
MLLPLAEDKQVKPVYFAGKGAGQLIGALFYFMVYQNPYRHVKRK